jgi:hypothetical protein
MKIEQRLWTANQGWHPAMAGGFPAQLVFLFGGRKALADQIVVGEARAAYPKACFIGCSTAGEICGTSVLDDSLVATAVEFEQTEFQVAGTTTGEIGDSFEAGVRLARMLGKEGLAHVFVLSNGLEVNGSELVRGLEKSLPKSVSVTGGLSGDGTRFEETLVLWNERLARDAIVAVGFYGNRLKVGYSSQGGWDTFGPERRISRSKANVLYELDGKSALELYKHYLGEHAGGLPATGLLFPLSVRKNREDRGIVRTILSVNEEEQSMTFAGDMPEGAYARLMKANFDRLIDGAADAARISCEVIGARRPDLAILISCVGRKMVLQQRIEEEVEGVREVMGPQTVMTGFYSYGEISPFNPNAKCQLHNQTMTITTFLEE